MMGQERKSSSRKLVSAAAAAAVSFSSSLRPMETDWSLSSRFSDIVKIENDFVDEMQF